jgi:hypothetical protein
MQGSSLHFSSVGRWEKRKPNQGTVVNQIFTEAKRAVYDLFVDGFPGILPGDLKYFSYVERGEKYILDLNLGV